MGCLIADCKLIGGETAEMKGIYLKNKFDLAGFATGEVIYRIPKPECINENCLIYGLESSGIHSNGYTLVRKILEKYDNIETSLIKELLKPTKIYMEVLDICKQYNKNIVGISHITGGGFKDNIERILPNNYSFTLKDWEFPEIFKWIQRESNLKRTDMLNTFNCGYGMVIISDKPLNIPNLDLIGNIVKLTENKVNN